MVAPRMVGLLTRLVGSGDPVSFIRDATAHFDAAHIGYLMQRGLVPWDLLPDRFGPAALAWLAQNSAVVGLSPEALEEAACHARPDCVTLLRTTEGRAWLKNLFGWRG